MNVTLGSYSVSERDVELGWLGLDVPAISIDDIAPWPPILPIGSTMTITLSGTMGAAAGTVEVSVWPEGSPTVSQSVTRWDDSVLEVDATASNVSAEGVGLPYYFSEEIFQLGVTTVAGYRAIEMVAFIPAPGNNAVQVISPVTTADSVFSVVTNGLPADGQQIEWTDASNTTVQADGTFTQEVPRNFNVRVWNVDLTWSEWSEVSVLSGVTQGLFKPAFRLLTSSVTQRLFR